MMAILFWFSIAVVIYTYVGYPLILVVLSLFFSKPIHKKDFTPKVSVVISVYNGEKYIEEKLHNCLSLNYPRGKLEILVGSDGSNDRTNEIIKSFVSYGVKFYSWKLRRGKINVLKNLIPKTNGEIILFTDDRQILDKNAIIELVKNFADPQVGCVSGELILKRENINYISKAMGFYWEYEKFLRKEESRLDSMIGATGAIYAIRKNLFVPPPSNIILDDVFIPLKIVQQGYRAIFDSNAKAHDKTTTCAKEEYKRKVRTLAGNWQIFYTFNETFNLFRSKIAFQLFSHKFLRVAIPFFLILAFVSNAVLWNKSPYGLILVLQVLFYISAVVGFFVRNKSVFFFHIPYVFCVMNIAALKGLYRFLTSKQKVTWEKANI